MNARNTLNALRKAAPEETAALESAIKEKPQTLADCGPLGADLFRAIRQQQHNNDALKCKLERKAWDLAKLKRNLATALEDIESTEMPETGWVVLCAYVDGKWEPRGCYDANNLPEELPDWHIMMPIPMPDSLRDWDGS